MPRILQSDGGKEVDANWIHHMCELSCIDKRTITPYSPRSDGKVERIMRDIVNILNKSLQGMKADWYHLLPQTQLWLNLRSHAVYGSTPFSIMFNRPFNGFNDFSRDQSRILTADEVRERYDYAQKVLFPEVYSRFNNRNNRLASKFNKLKTTLSDQFPDGSIVMLENPRRTSKFNPRYVGPFKVLRRNRGGAYVIQDMSGKLYSRNASAAQLKLISDEAGEDEYEVERILQHRGEPNNYQYLIKWKNFSNTWNTWEPYHNLTNCAKMIDEYWKSTGLVKPWKSTPKSKQPRSRKTVRTETPISATPTIIPNRQFIRRSNRIANQ